MSSSERGRMYPAHNSKLIQISPRITEALAGNHPVVALESTIITHGMPYRQNLETALAVEDCVRDEGAEPATTAMIDGRLIVGVEGESLEQLAQLGHRAAKISRRDVAALAAAGATGGTTVATTMIIAAASGIAVFATGGIGGVHRGASETFDISADLTELSRSPVAVVCAGAKSILDIGKTLEVLEMHGVPVLGYKTSAFPAFFARESGHDVDFEIDSVAELARIMRAHWSLGRLVAPGQNSSSGGLVIANPIPEPDALDAAEIDSMIEMAIEKADQEGVSRKALTPFLLDWLFKKTDGKTLTANIALVKNNARLAARIAKAYAQGQDDAQTLE